MIHRRPPRLVASFESVEPRIALSGVSGISQGTPLVDVSAINPLFGQVVAEKRQAALELSQAERESLLVDMTAAKLEAMREAATFKLASGIVSGAPALVGGAVFPGLDAVAVREGSKPKLATGFASGAPTLAGGAPFAGLDAVALERSVAVQQERLAKAQKAEAQLADLQQRAELMTEELQNILTKLQKSMQAIVSNLR